MKNANPLDPSTSQRIESQIQERVHSGYTAPCGWVFKGLSFFFVTDTHTNEENEDPRSFDLALTLLQNYAVFAGARIVNSMKSPDITHFIVDANSASSMNVASLRQTMAAMASHKVPRLVSSKWVEESWKNCTLLDEESKHFLHFFCGTSD